MIPPSVKWSFYLGAGVFFLAVAWTVFRSFEYSPEELEAFEAHDNKDIDEEEVKREVPIEPGAGDKKIIFGSLFTVVGAALSVYLILDAYDYGLYVFSFGILALGLVALIAGLIQKNGNIDQGLVVVMHDFLHMPKTMIQLAVVQFFSWFALFAMWIYTTAAVTSHIYGTSDTTSLLYNEGADWVGVLFAVYNGFAAVIAFGLAPMAKLTSRKVVHMFSLLAGGLSLIGIYYLNFSIDFSLFGFDVMISSPMLLLIPMLGIGLAWASILAMPYAILAGALPAKKMGLYMGIFNFFIVIPQIVAASLLGFFTRSLFGGEAIYALILGGVSMLIAAVSMIFVDDVDADTNNLI